MAKNILMVLTSNDKLGDTGEQVHKNSMILPQHAAVS